MGLHIPIGRQLQALVTVGDGGFPQLELQAGHGTVRVQGWVPVIGDNAICRWHSISRGNKGVEKDRFRLGFKQSLNWMIEDIRFRVEALCAYIVLLLEVTIPLLLKQSRLGGIPSHGSDEGL